MPRSKGKPKPYTNEIDKGIDLMNRWNYCQKIAQLMYKGSYNDEEIKAIYHKQVKIFDEQTK